MVFQITDNNKRLFAEMNYVIGLFTDLKRAFDAKIEDKLYL